MSILNTYQKTTKFNKNELKNIILCDTYKIGSFREKRAMNFISKTWKWKCYKSNLEIDKFHDIDLIAYDLNNQLNLIQVKSLKMIKSIKISEKAIKFAKENNANLYYFFVGGENERIWIKRIEWK
ncbi:MAG: hypothetical protein H9897_00550 [Candidatus Ureaplasma intestinipullorum]|uniref:Uncharacterized protein n=1 Tax=Candidatus Ureaplasma intestinipullorum TaxID=2838770 RepID=A0A9E2KVQ6_9BACT|nr:hypothetical protein [Candidatus Ureaplasma intestinipullorum]